MKSELKRVLGFGIPSVVTVGMAIKAGVVEYQANDYHGLPFQLLVGCVVLVAGITSCLPITWWKRILAFVAAVCLVVELVVWTSLPICLFTRNSYEFENLAQGVALVTIVLIVIQYVCIDPLFPDKVFSKGSQ